MFAKLKKKVEDLEGADLHKLANSISFSSGSIPEKTASRSTMKSTDNISITGSTTSLSSSTQGASRSEESEAVQAAEKKWRQRLGDVENEWKQKLVEVQNEWRVKVMCHEHEKEQLSKERDTLTQQKKKLEEEVKELKSYQDKCLQAEETLEKLRQAKESETASLNLLLSNASVEVEDYKAKDDLMQEQLEKKDGEIRALQLQVSQFSSSMNEGSAEDQQNLQDLLKDSADMASRLKSLEENLAAKEEEVVRWQRQYDQAKCALEAMTNNWQEEKARNMCLQDKLAQLAEEKNSFMVRNAEVSQQASLAQQELDRSQKELSELSLKARQLEEDNQRLKHLLSDAEARDESSERVAKLRSQVAELEASTSEKNKTIKLQQQRLADMKKTLQKELKGTGQLGAEVTDGVGSIPSASPAAARKNSSASPVPKSDLDEVNFMYLKHVIFKFLTSREYEAQHLTRAVSTLLKLTPDEEKLLKETLEWKMSWFRQKPDLGSGQNALYIPPTH